MIPNGFHAFADAHGISAFHPSTWGTEDHAAFIAWKLAAFRARWKAAMANGDVEITRRQQGRDYIVRRVKDDLAGALAPAPSATYVFCPCHPSDTWPSPAKVREPRTPGEIVAWLTLEFSPGTAALEAAALVPAQRRRRPAGRLLARVHRRRRREVR